MKGAWAVLFLSLEFVVPGWLGSEDVVDDIIGSGNVSLEGAC